MANNKSTPPATVKTDTQENNVVEKPVATANEDNEPRYTVSELAANAGKLFSTRPECIEAALKLEKKDECTIKQAEEIVKKFLERKVE